jgi:hypothetical protein
MVAEQSCLCDAAGVEAAEQDLATSPALVHLTHCQHVADLCVLNSSSSSGGGGSETVAL